MSRIEARIWEKTNYTLIATDTSFILCVPPGTTLLPTPLRLKCGELLQVGDSFSEMYGRKKSAGFLRFVTDTPITYRGIYPSCEDGQLACFTPPSGLVCPAELNPPKALFFAWGWSEEHQIFLFSTRYLSSRAIETEVLVRAERNGSSEAERSTPVWPTPGQN